MTTTKAIDKDKEIANSIRSFWQECKVRAQLRRAEKKEELREDPAGSVEDFFLEPEEELPF